MAAALTPQQLSQQVAAQGEALRVLAEGMHALSQRMTRVEATLVDFDARLVSLEVATRPPAEPARYRIRGKQAPPGPYQAGTLLRPAAALPLPWVEQWSPTYNMPYFWHPHTGASVWERPRM